jgi:hypothetical protein
MADFDWQLEIIWEVLGGTVPQKLLTNVAVTEMLELKSAAGVTQRRNGSAHVKRSEASAIIMGYGLHRHLLDASLFDLRDPARFRAELRSHNVGIYANSGGRRLVQMLNRALVKDGLSISLQRGFGRRGIGYSGPPQTRLLTLYPDEQIRLVIAAEPGRHVAVIQFAHGTSDLIETLAPTAVHPDTLVERSNSGKGSLILPKDGIDGLTIEREPGLCRLMVIEGEDDLINLFSCGQLLALEGSRPGEMHEDEALPAPKPPRLSEFFLQKIIAWLENNLKARLRTAEVEFLVTAN